MAPVSSVAFAVSDVAPAQESLREIPYPHAVAGLLSARPVWYRSAAAALRPVEENVNSLWEQMQRGPDEQNRLLTKWSAAFQTLRDLRGRAENDTAAQEEYLQSNRHGLEACSRYHGRLVADVLCHPLLKALHAAFCDHRPICLSPDMVWLMIAQGAANHINVNAKELRPRFVKYAGKASLIVRRDDFVKGSPENPWAEVFPEFARQLRKHIGDETHAFFTKCFSTTGPVEQAAGQVVLMDAAQAYFTYHTLTLCGIPSVTLEGTSEDWGAVREHAQLLSRFGLESWLTALEPILRQFSQACQGEPDAEFWRSMYKLNSFSGGASVTGWVTTFFPYLKNWSTLLPTEPNPEIVGLNSCEREYEGVDLSDFPSGLAAVPFTWNYYGTSFDMQFLAGFVGVAQDPQTFCLRPEIGWAVRDVGTAIA
jgi:hypothetical protein